MRGSRHRPLRHQVERDYRTAAVRATAYSRRGGFRGTTRRRCGGLTKQVAGNVENGETAMLLRERLEVRLDENLDGLVAGVGLDTDTAWAVAGSGP